MVPSRQKRKSPKKKQKPVLFHWRRWGKSTSGFGLRNLRMREANKKTVAPPKSPLKSPDRHQSNLWPWSSAANNIAKPALAYRNPAKLGAVPGFLPGGAAGIP